MDRLLPPRAWIPCSATAANITMGFGAILAAADGRFEIAVYLLYLAVWLDMADGRLARQFNATSRLGMELDSLSDALSFGLAPAFLVFRSSLQELGGVGVAVAVTYLLAGVFRLGRYNVLANEHAKTGRTRGLPIPGAAGYLMAVALMRDHMSPAMAAGVVLLMAFAMVSNVQLPEFRGGSTVTTMLLGGLLCYTAVVVWPSWSTIALWNAWNAVIYLAARREDRANEGLANASPG